MTYAFEALRAVPTWVWLAVVAVLAEVGILCAWLAEYRRARTAERALRKVEGRARLWRALAENADGAFIGKRTQIAPQYHAPREG